MSQTLAPVGSDAPIAGFFPYRGRVLALLCATMFFVIIARAIGFRELGNLR
jgi:hypothetical protein